MYEQLKLRDTIRLEPEGIKLGQRHHFDIGFEAAIPIPNGASRLKNKLNKLVAYPMAAEFLDRHLKSGAAAAVAEARR